MQTRSHFSPFAGLPLSSQPHRPNHQQQPDQEYHAKWGQRWNQFMGSRWIVGRWVWSWRGCWLSRTDLSILTRFRRLGLIALDRSAVGERCPLCACAHCNIQRHACLWRSCTEITDIPCNGARTCIIASYMLNIVWDLWIKFHKTTIGRPWHKHIQQKQLVIYYREKNAEEAGLIKKYSKRSSE